MSIKERISDLFEKYSVQLEVEEKEEEKKERLLSQPLRLTAGKKSKPTRKPLPSVFLFS